MAFPLTQEQRDIVENRGGELLVSAAAGSGKTRVLVERVLERVTKERLDIDRFLIITFTKAAAAELRSRIAQELSQRLAQNPNDRHLRKQTTLLYRAQISTIHSFCSVFLRENGHLLDLDPDFRLCEESEAQVLMVQTLDQLLEERYEGLTAGDPFAQLVDTMAAGRDDSALVQIVLDIYGRIQSHPDPVGWLLQQKECWDAGQIKDMASTKWGALLLNDAKRQVAYDAQHLEQLCQLAATDELLRENYLPSLQDSLQGAQRFLTAKSWDDAVACTPIPFPTVGRKRKRTRELTPDLLVSAEETMAVVKRSRDKIKKRLETVAEYFSESNQEHLEDLRQNGPAIQGLMDLVLDFQSAYAREKRRRDLVDFSDLEHFVVQLLLDENGKPNQLAQHWAKRYVEILVDEYQDTNQVQNAIFHAISNEGKTLFEVGDVKQSIYRFRLADPTIFLDKFARFAPAVQAQEGEGRRCVLSRNFRSRAEVLLGCNDLFRAIMSKEFGELDYTDEQALVPGADYPQADDYAVELDLIDLSHLGEQEGEKENKDFLEARFVAGRIRELLRRPLMITEKGELRPVRSSDIMILLRSPGTLLHHYAKAFAESGIPWTAEGAGELFETTEVNAALSMLQIVDNPRQDVALIAALRSPVYGFTADRLAMIRAEAEGDFYDALVSAAERGEQDCVRFLQELQALRFDAGDKTCRQLIWHIYETSNLMGVFGAMDAGRERQENLLMFYSLAGAMEASGCATLFQFLLRLERMRSSGAKLSVPTNGTQGDGVSILSIHRSKGLEKPVVFVCGLSRKFNSEDNRRPILFHSELGVGPSGLARRGRVMVEYPMLARQAVARQLEREMLAEELRLLYVAMTRAKEKLVMTMGLTEGLRGIERLRDDLEVPISPETLEMQPSVGRWILLHALTRPESEALRSLAGLPQVIAPDLGPQWKIRWVDGEELPRPRKWSGRFADLSQEENGNPEELAAQLSWKYPYAKYVDMPSKLTATQLKGRSLDSEAAEQALVMGEKGRLEITRPDFIAEKRGLTAAQRGTAFHLALQYLPLDGDHSPQGISRELDRLVSEGFLTQMQREVISVSRLAAFFSSPVGRDMACAKQCCREYKFSLLIPAEEPSADAEQEEILLQGVVDAWFENGDGITVVDFKSDRICTGEEAVRAEVYRPQLEAYKKALETILDKPVSRCVLWFLATGVAVEW